VSGDVRDARSALRGVPWPLLALVLVEVAVLGLAFLRKEPLDLSVYRAGGRSVLSGSDSLYGSPLTSDLSFTYPPFAGVLFAPLSLISRPLAAVVLFVLSLTALARSAWLVAGEVRGRGLVGGWNRPTTTMAFVAGSLLAEPYLSTLYAGQINVLIMWAVLEDLLGRPSRWSGIRIGIATGVKLVPGLFLVLLAVIGNRRAFVRAAATAIGTVVIGVLVLPRSSQDYWTRVAFDGNRIGDVGFSSNQSINGVLWRLLGPGGNTAVWAVAVAAVAVASLATARARWRRGTRLASISATTCGALLVSPISWTHHWVWATVFVLVLTTDITRSRWARTPATWLALAWVVALTSHLTWWAATGGDQEHTAPLLTQLVADSYVILGALTLLWFSRTAWTAATGTPPSCPSTVTCGEASDR
jgi:alpha-1,2-mannosyltransferase